MESFAIKLELNLDFCNILISCRESFIFKEIFQNVTGCKEDTNLVKTALEIIMKLVLLFFREREMDCINK